MQNNIVAPIAFSIAFISYKLGQVATQALVVSMINISKDIRNSFVSK